jgi:hypothetical protein
MVAGEEQCPAGWCEHEVRRVAGLHVLDLADRGHARRFLVRLVSLDGDVRDGNIAPDHDQTPQPVSWGASSLERRYFNAYFAGRGDRPPPDGGGVLFQQRRRIRGHAHGTRAAVERRDVNFDLFRAKLASLVK